MRQEKDRNTSCGQTDAATNPRGLGAEQLGDTAAAKGTQAVHSIAHMIGVQGKAKGHLVLSCKKRTNECKRTATLQ